MKGDIYSRTSYIPKINSNHYLSDCSAVTCLTGCGDVELLFKDGVLETSPFPSTFQPFSECQTTVTVPEDKYIALQFTDYRVSIGQDSTTTTWASESDRWITKLGCHLCVALPTFTVCPSPCTYLTITVKP